MEGRGEGEGKAPLDSAAGREDHPAGTADEELLDATAISVETDASRIDRVRSELDLGFRTLSGVGKAVAFFGSARTAPEDAYYALARQVACRLAEAGFAV